MPSDPKNPDIEKIVEEIHAGSFGVLDSDFLSQSVSIMMRENPILVDETATLNDVVNIFKHNRIGCVLVKGEDARLVGIFTERDYILKIAGREQEHLREPITSFMTSNPVVLPPDGTIAYALNLMSQGGFRHIPILSRDERVLGVISVKDVVDHMVGSLTNDLLHFDIEE